MNDAQEIAQVAIRPGTARDHSFIMATWLNSFRHRSPFAFRLRDVEFFPFHHPIAEAILLRATVSVAALEDDPNVIIGYLITEHGPGWHRLHFAYTKKEFRRMRVLTQLLEESHLPADLRGVEASR